jgi:hypothetical protein
VKQEYDIAETNDICCDTQCGSQDPYDGVPVRKIGRRSLNLFAEIITSKYNPSTMMSAIDYITEFETFIVTYNSQQCDEQCKFQGMMLWNLLQNAFSGVPCLCNIVMHKQEMVVKGISKASYKDNKRLLISAATVYNETRAMHQMTLSGTVKVD